jgi:hypothetical protein
MHEVLLHHLPPEREIPSQRFLEMLTLPKFQKALDIAAKRTRRTGLETGFEVDDFPKSPFWIQEVKVGGVDGMAEARVIAEIDGEYPELWKRIDFFNFHFHPVSDEIIVPSSSDLKQFTWKDGIPEYLGVGQVDGRGNITILVVARPRYWLIDDDIEAYKEAFGFGFAQIKDYQVIQGILKTIGLNSFLVEFNPRSS